MSAWEHLPDILPRVNALPYSFTRPAPNDRRATGGGRRPLTMRIASAVGWLLR